jgi:cytochrome c-type biogenesis protein CcmH
MNRRHAIAAGVLAVAGLPRRARAVAVHTHALQGGAPQELGTQDDVARLSNPFVAGRDRARPTEFDNDPFIIAVEERIKCNCGCAHSLYVCRTTDFNCGFWQDLHAEVISYAQQEMSAREIIDRYVARHGEQYLMAPPPEGFNLTGYLVPGAVISTIGTIITWFLVRRHRMAAVEVPGGGRYPTAVGVSAADAARLEEELQRLDV